jgi:hypothetical protein
VIRCNDVLEKKRIETDGGTEVGIVRARPIIRVFFDGDVKPSRVLREFTMVSR